METEEKPINILDLANKNTSPEEFDEIVKNLLSDEDKRVLGEHALEKARLAFLYLSPYAPEPATFNKEAFKFSVGFDEVTGESLQEKEVEQLLKITKRTGIVKDVQGGRLSISQNAGETFGSILKKYEE